MQTGSSGPIGPNSALEFIDRNQVPDLLDRMVAATALALQVPLVSRDGKIRESIVQTIW